jgi:NADPH-dependent 2,4-dienoyl-CoA reductase/sulfur reductase-like enzyme
MKIRYLEPILHRNKATLSNHLGKLNFSRPTTQQSDVIVIGAGISGLAAAAALKQAGYRTVVLEAKDKIGESLILKSRRKNQHF